MQTYAGKNNPQQQKLMLATSKQWKKAHLFAQCDFREMFQGNEIQKFQDMSSVYNFLIMEVIHIEKQDMFAFEAILHGKL